MATLHKSKQITREKPILQLKVRGPGIRSGHIPVSDLIKICEELQKTVNRQAESMQGKKTLHPGPIVDSIRRECTLELIGIKKGTTSLQFALGKTQMTLPMPEQTSFGADVIGELAATIKSLGNGDISSQEINAGVLQGLYQLGGVIEDKHISQIEWIAPKMNGRRRSTGLLNEAIRERVATRLSSPRKAKIQFDGVLDMADFKPGDKRCRIDPALGASVMCSFDDRHAAKIQSLLRTPVRATGEATLKPYTDRIELLHIEEIERLPSLSLGEGNFFAGSSIAELAAAQNVKPLKSISVLAGGFPDDLDVDKFLEDIYSNRK